MSSASRFLRSIFHKLKIRHRFPRSVIHAGVIVDGASQLGDWSVLFSDVRLASSSLGTYSYVQARSCLYEVDVGPFCSIAADVSIGLVDHPTFMVSTSPVFYDNTQPLPKFLVNEKLHHEHRIRTVVEADVWIGYGVRVRAGVRIGIGSIIGAGAVVTRDIPPYTIAAGVPCRVVRDRFPKEIKQQLLDSRWWELDQEHLSRLAPEFVDPIRFLSALNCLKKP